MANLKWRGSMMPRVRAYCRARLSSSSSMTTGNSGHSAEVKMHVVCNGYTFRVAQLGPDFLILEEADEFDGPAEVILSVDGVKHTPHFQVQFGPPTNKKTILFSSP